MKIGTTHPKVVERNNLEETDLSECPLSNQSKSHLPVLRDAHSPALESLLMPDTASFGHVVKKWQRHHSRACILPYGPLYGLSNPHTNLVPIFGKPISQ